MATLKEKCVSNSTTILSSPITEIIEDQRKTRSVFDLTYNPLYGLKALCGKRQYMEDNASIFLNLVDLPLSMFVSADNLVDEDPSKKISTHFFGIFDGHGGDKVSDFCGKRLHAVLKEELHLLKQETTTTESLQSIWENVFTLCFQKIDDEVGGLTSRVVPDGDNFIKICQPVASGDVGSTAIVALLSASHIIVSNCGDCRAVLLRGKEVFPLSTDQKPNRPDEFERIHAAGGVVMDWQGASRVYGVLAMSRSIGDRNLKPTVISVPEITLTARRRDDELLVLASDGLWDVLTNDQRST